MTNVISTLKKTLAIASCAGFLWGCGAYDLGDEKPIAVTVNATAPTWDNGIGELVNKKCANCHMPLSKRGEFVPADVPKRTILDIAKQSFFDSQGAVQDQGYAMLVYRRTFQDPVNPMPKKFATPLVGDEAAALKKYLESQGFGDQCAAGGSTTLTYADVQPKINSTCASSGCHNTGNSARKSLDSLEGIRGSWHAAISYIAAGAMPQGTAGFRTTPEGAKVFEWLCFGNEFKDLR